MGVVLAAFNVINSFYESHFIMSYNLYLCLKKFDHKVASILNTVNSVLYSFGPFTFIFMTNFAILFKFMRAKCKRNSIESTNQALAKAATRGDSYGGHGFRYISNSRSISFCGLGTVA